MFHLGVDGTAVLPPALPLHHTDVLLRSHMWLVWSPLALRHTPGAPPAPCSYEALGALYG
jgi:hypothetical protein